MFPDLSHHDPNAPISGDQAAQLGIHAYTVPPAGNVPGGTSPTHAATQARQLVDQYAHEPFYLSNALQQLKQQYLAEHFHIIIKPADQ